MRQCGVPASALKMWSAKLVALGYLIDQISDLNYGSSSLSTSRYKVLIVDETETSVGAKVRQRQSEGNWKRAMAKSKTVPSSPKNMTVTHRSNDGRMCLQDTLVSREIKQVLTAGTIVDEELMNDHKSNYILAIKEDILPSASLPLMDSFASLISMVR